MIAAGVVIVWAITVPLFNIRDTWHASLNTERQSLPF